MASWSETKSESKPDSGAKSTDAIVSSGSRPEDGGNQSKLSGETQPSAGINIDNSGAAPSSEAPKAGADGEPSLGKTLSAARERRGVSRDDVARETRVPAHYIDMIERSDYGLISDQLYLMPFVRRYAAFLELDGEEVAMRFVREVQRAEGAAVPRMSEPLTLHDRKRTPWARVAVVIIVLAAIVVLYVIASEHHRGEFGFHRPAPPVDPAAPNAALAPAADAPAPAPVPVAHDCARAHDCASTDGCASTDDAAAAAGHGSVADAAERCRRCSYDAERAHIRSKRLRPRALPRLPIANPNSRMRDALAARCS